MNSEGPGATGEAWLLKQLANISDVQTAVDVGSNTDVFGLEELESAEIFAFEPHPKTFKLAQKMVDKSNRKNVELVNAALGAERGTMKLWDFADDAKLKATQPTSTLSSLDKSVIEKFHGQKAQSFTVKVETLDAYAQSQSIKHINVLKIDTEGFELQVLLGAKTLLRKNSIDLIQFEFNEMNVFTRTFFKDFVDLLPDYNFYRLLPSGLLPLGEYRPLTHEIFGFQNVVALPKRRGWWGRLV